MTDSATSATSATSLTSLTSLTSPAHESEIAPAMEPTEPTEPTGHETESEQESEPQNESVVESSAAGWVNGVVHDVPGSGHRPGSEDDPSADASAERADVDTPSGLDDPDPEGHDHLDDLDDLDGPGSKDLGVGPVGDDGSPATGEPPAAADPDGAPRRGNRVRLLEKEGEVAADFLERLLDIADLDGDIEVDIDGDRAAVAIVDSEDGRVPRRLVGSEGKVLEALQELTRLAVQAETGERSRLMLDVAGHRAQRRVQLVEVARTAIAEVKTTGAKKGLEDMSAFERKIVHDEVAAAGLESESEGVEPHRHIVVFPA